jgi:hypothetical protein
VHEGNDVVDEKRLLELAPAAAALLHLGWRMARRRRRARDASADGGAPRPGEQLGANWCDVARDVLADDQKLNRLIRFLDYLLSRMAALIFGLLVVAGVITWVVYR